MPEILRASGVKHVYPDGTILQNRGLDFVVNTSEKVALLGPNGSGKSTLLFHLLGLLKPDEGTIRVFGHDPSKDFEHISERIGMVLQDPDEQIIAPTVRDDIEFSPINYGHPPEEIRQMVARVADNLEITHLLNKVPQYLSGGERLKVALAGALVLRPELLILDEPFEGLDSSSKLELVALLNRLSKENSMAAVVATHDVNLVPHFADTVYLLAKGGEITERGTPERVLSQTDLLAAHDIEPPVISLLANELRKHGLDLGHPLTVEDALTSLLRRFAPWDKTPPRPEVQESPDDNIHEADR